MATKGESKGQKTLSVANVRNLDRKKNTWTIRSRAGSHSAETAVPLGFVVRDLLGLAENMKEVKNILTNGLVKVNGKIRKNYRHSVGLFDVVEVTSKKEKYRVVFDEKGRIELKKMNEKEEITRLYKVLDKKLVKSGKTQLSLDDGSVLLSDEAVKTGDTLKLSLPDRKVLGRYELKQGNMAYVVGGTHVGSVATIKDISKGTANKPSLVDMQKGNLEFKTVAENIFIIGDKKAGINLGE